MTSEVCRKALAAESLGRNDARLRASPQDYQWTIRPIIEEEDYRGQLLRAFSQYSPEAANDGSRAWRRWSTTVEAQSPSGAALVVLILMATDLKTGIKLVP